MPSRKIDARALAALLACGISLLGGGVRAKESASRRARRLPHRRAAAIETPPPSTTAPDTTAMPPVAAQTPPPEIPAASTAPPPIIAPATKPAPKPQNPAPEPAAVAEEHARPPAPQISPQLSEDAKANLPARDWRRSRSRAEQSAAGERKAAERASKWISSTKSKASSTNRTMPPRKAIWRAPETWHRKRALLSVELVNSL